MYIYTHIFISHPKNNQYISFDILNKRKHLQKKTLCERRTSEGKGFFRTKKFNCKTICNDYWSQGETQMVAFFSEGMERESKATFKTQNEI